jgi:hypothetical protein
LGVAPAHPRTLGLSIGPELIGHRAGLFFCADVFLHQYQSAPLDLHSDHFYDARRDLIEARLAEIGMRPGGAARLGMQHVTS